MLTKSPTELTTADIEALVASREPESRSLEYKRAAIGPTDAHDHLLEGAMVDSSRSEGSPGDISGLYDAVVSDAGDSADLTGGESVSSEAPDAPVATVS